MVEHNIDVMRHCVYTYLNHMRHIRDDIKAISQQISEIRHAAIGLRGIEYNRDKVKVSPDGDKVGEALARIEELQAELSDRILNCYEQYDEAEQLCAPHHVGRYVLWLSRVKGRTYAEIARIVHYSDTYIYELAAGGIVDLYYAMPEEYRRNSIPNAQP